MKLDLILKIIFVFYHNVSNIIKNYKMSDILKGNKEEKKKSTLPLENVFDEHSTQSIQQTNSNDYEGKPLVLDEKQILSDKRDKINLRISDKGNNQSLIN